jgi:hypothetical protein
MDSIRRRALIDATEWVCGYCADRDNWQPAKKGASEWWWHWSAKGLNVRNACSAWGIWENIEKEKCYGSGSQSVQSQS